MRVAVTNANQVGICHLPFAICIVAHDSAISEPEGQG